MRIILLTLLCTLSLAARDPLAKRIHHADTARFRSQKSVHGGAGELAFGAMFGSTIMARMSLFIGRLTFLFQEWIHLIPRNTGP